MSSIAAALWPIPVPKPETLRREPASQAFMLLRVAFAVAPIAFGLDKFAELMISDWPKYLAPEFNDLIPGSAQDAMYMVGAIEIVAGLVVALSPRFGGLLVAGWLAGIIVSLLLVVSTPISRCATSGCWSAPSPSRVWPALTRCGLERGRLCAASESCRAA